MIEIQLGKTHEPPSSAGTKRMRRLVQIVFSLDVGSNKTIGELAKNLGVSVRTIHRDLQLLAQADVPLCQDVDSGCYYVSPASSVLSLSLQGSEQRVLRSMIQQMMDSPDRFGDPDSARTCATKLKKLLADTQVLGEQRSHADTDHERLTDRRNIA